MVPVKIAQVAISEAGYDFDKPYDYVISPALADTAKPGCRVLVPFGKGNRKVVGIILSVHETTGLEKIKSILEVIDTEPVLNGELLKLAEWLSGHTFCTVYDAVKSMLPAGLNLKNVISYRLAEDISRYDLDKLDEDSRRMAEYLQKSKAAVKRERLLEIMGLSPDSDLPEKLVKKGLLKRIDDAIRRVSDATLKMARLAVNEEKLSDFLEICTASQRSVLELLKDVGAACVKEICYFAGVSAAVVNNLAKKGIIEFFEQETYRNPNRDKPLYTDTGEIVLTPEQEAVYRSLVEQYRKGYTEKKVNASLLFGVTGSGKTQVYLKLLDDVIAEGRQALVMVPEISLTPQMLSIFLARYGEKVAVMHSALSLGERLDEWKRVKRGEAQIVVGTRSAVFAPFSNIGLIIVDEEQEYTYKSESSPRYHARDVATFRAVYHKALLLLCSATPSIGTYYKAENGHYMLNRLPHRYGNATLPEVQTVDMREELFSGNNKILSRTLYEALKSNMEQGNKSILLLNRRGFNTFLSCAACGHVITCPQCSISLTYHFANKRLMCHYCGYSVGYTEKCSQCGEPCVKFMGYGTQRLEQEIEELFPEARVLRMDTDTTMSRYAFEDKIQQFSQDEYDIMIGTQMVAKGLDFPDVTLVGVLSADQSLYDDDFRSYERTFSLLTQVVGRSGRGNLKGKAIIQTITPDSEIISLAAAQNYELFYKNEIAFRRALVYPPFCDICVIGFAGVNEAEVKRGAQDFFEELKVKVSEEYESLKLIIMGPSPAKIVKLSNKFRYRIIVKCRMSSATRTLFGTLLMSFYRNKRHKNVTAFIDVNPDDVM